MKSRLENFAVHRVRSGFDLQRRTCGAERHGRGPHVRRHVQAVHHPEVVSSRASPDRVQVRPGKRHVSLGPGLRGRRGGVNVLVRGASRVTTGGGLEALSLIRRIGFAFEKHRGGEAPCISQFSRASRQCPRPCSCRPAAALCRSRLALFPVARGLKRCGQSTLRHLPPRAPSRGTSEFVA